MPTICGLVSGADRSAVRPSNTPSTPPSTIPNTGFFMPSSVAHLFTVVHGRLYGTHGLQRISARRITM